MTTARALLLCGGEARRWRNHLGVTKHLVPIDGRPLLLDTVTKLRENGVHDIVVVGREDVLGHLGVRCHHVGDQASAPPKAKFLSARSMWNDDGQTILMFGDVHFTQTALNALLAPAHRCINFVGRMTGSRMTGCRHAEIFALSFPAQAADEIVEELERLDLTGAGDDRPAGWLLFEALSRRGAIGRLQAADGVVFHHVDDLTEDFDFPDDYASWLAARARATAGRLKGPRNLRKVWQRRAQLAALAGFCAGVVLTVLIT
jgi:NDP-sugar pyrophosphorylase family protein